MGIEDVAVLAACVYIEPRVTITSTLSRTNWEGESHGKSRIGAEGGTRTPTGCPTRPSNVRVCQFRHFGEVRGVSITLSRATDNSPDALAQARVERVANSLTEEVVGEHRQ